METLVIDNFKGSMTPYVDGNINSGLANVIEVFGYDPFIKPGNLTWYESATQIDSSGAVITDLILAGKTRLENGIVYVYAIGHTGRLYKIQVNDPTTYNPNYDNPVLLATLAVDSPTFTRGGFIDFYGATEKIYIGHDKGVNSINFNGSGEAAVGVSATWTQNVPRPFIQFLGKLYIGNGTNIAEVDTTATVTTYTKLSPSFPTGSQVRDLDVTPDGNYLQAVVAESALPDITATTPNTSILSPSDSYVFFWNGTDAGYTSYTTYAGVDLSANLIFGDQAYTFGYDVRGGGVWNPTRKFLTSSPNSAFGNAPSPNAVIGAGNMMLLASTLPFNGHLEMLLTMYGTPSEYEYQEGYWAPYGQAATGDETDVLQIPYQGLVSNFGQGYATNGYTDGIFGEPKIYFSTLETSASTTKYKLYKWSLAPSGLGTALVDAVYQTQTQIFSKKITIKAIRVYAEPWVAGNSFQIDLIGSGGTPMTNGTKTFTAQNTNQANPMYVGTDYAWWNPTDGGGIAPTYALAIRVTNLGEVNHTINKIEIDYAIGGQ